MKLLRGTPGLLALVGVAVLVACSTLDLDNVQLPGSTPGASYVGSETCASCHETQAQYFKSDEHATVQVKVVEEGEGEPVAVEGCEICHGPGSLHVENDGDKSKILRESPDRCFACHTERLAEFKMQHHHPVPEGRMTCTDCHDLHGSDVRATAGAMLKRGQSKCFKCHKEQSGPFVFEHDALREGCQVCHSPHGSVQDKMLVAGQSVLCLRCHFDVNTNGVGLAGSGVSHGPDSTQTGTGGGLGHNFDIGNGEECIDHHRAPHGSNIWRTLNR